jgi:glycosyltransferase involved in cell wall biosynthesis
MNIVLYTVSCLPTIGGMEMVVHHLADSLLDLGHKVRVVTGGGCWSQGGVHYNYPVHRWPTLKGLFPEQERLMQLFLDTGIWGCDVIHAHDTYLTGYAGIRLKRHRNIPLVVTPHGEDIHVIPEIGFGVRLDPRLEPKVTRTLEEADILTAISAAVETSLLDAGAGREKIRRIPNGVDVKRFQQSASTDVHKRFRIPEGSRPILTVGNYYPRKGFEVLVRSMPTILAREPRAHLVIVGGNTEIMRPLIGELGLYESVTLTGSISWSIGSNGKRAQGVQVEPDHLADLYRASEVYVSAGMSDGAEGLSLALLDAMATELPIVATDISGNRDIIQQGKSGFLVPPSDPQRLAEAVIQLLGDSDLKSSMGAKAAEIVSKYEWTQVARQYVAVYEEAIEATKRSSRRKCQGSDGSFRLM